MKVKTVSPLAKALDRAYYEDYLYSSESNVPKFFREHYGIEYSGSYDDETFEVHVVDQHLYLLFLLQWGSDDR